MADLLLRGGRATVQLERDGDDVVATCVLHRRTLGQPSVEPCSWTESYDTMSDAVEYAADHADRGTL